MHHKKRIVIGLLVVALILFATQAGIWVRETAHAQSETDKQNIEIQHAPNEMPFVASILLLIAAGALASIPQREIEREADERAAHA